MIVAAGGCGINSNENLPDLSSKQEPLPSGRSPLNNAEQKRAIDAMIAKRDAQSKEAGQTQATEGGAAQTRQR